MDSLTARLTSRKFLTMVAAVLVAIAGVLNQTIDPGTGANLIVTAVVAYIAAEGAADVARVVVNPTPRGPEAVAAPVETPPVVPALPAVPGRPLHTRKTATVRLQIKRAGAPDASK